MSGDWRATPMHGYHVRGASVPVTATPVTGTSFPSATAANPMHLSELESEVDAAADAWRMDMERRSARVNAGRVQQLLHQSSSSMQRSMPLHHPSSSQQPVKIEHSKLTKDKQEEIFRQYQTLLLQWCFVNAQQQACFESQQTKALSDISLVGEELDRLHVSLCAQRSHLARRALLQKLDRMLQHQSGISRELMPLLDTFEAKLSRLHRAVQRSKRRVGLEGVRVGDGHALDEALRRAELQLESISETIHPHLPTFHTLSTHSSTLRQSIEEEVRELGGLASLLNDAWALERDTRCLRIEHLQRDKVAQMEADLLQERDPYKVMPF